MYPVDLLKVCQRSWLSRFQLLELIVISDTNANVLSFCRRSLHRFIECGFYDLQNRGSAHIMERGVQCHRWCWWDRPFCARMGPPS